MSASRLTHFLSGYFHEDWLVEAGSDAEVVSLYLGSGVSQSEVLELRSEMEAAAREQESTNAEAWLLTVYGCYYLPGVDGLTASAWLRRLAGLLGNPCADHPCKTGQGANE